MSERLKPYQWVGENLSPEIAWLELKRTSPAIVSYLEKDRDKVFPEYDLAFDALRKAWRDGGESVSQAGDAHFARLAEDVSKGREGLGKDFLASSKGMWAYLHKEVYQRRYQEILTSDDPALRSVLENQGGVIDKEDMKRMLRKDAKRFARMLLEAAQERGVSGNAYIKRKLEVLVLEAEVDSQPRSQDVGDETPRLYQMPLDKFLHIANPESYVEAFVHEGMALLAGKGHMTYNLNSALPLINRYEDVDLISLWNEICKRPFKEMRVDIESQLRKQGVWDIDDAGIVAFLRQKNPDLLENDQFIKGMGFDVYRKLWESVGDEVKRAYQDSVEKMLSGEEFDKRYLEGGVEGEKRLVMEVVESMYCLENALVWDVKGGNKIEELWDELVDRWDRLQYRTNRLRNMSTEEMQSSFSGYQSPRGIISVAQLFYREDWYENRRQIKLGKSRELVEGIGSNTSERLEQVRVLLGVGLDDPAQSLFQYLQGSIFSGDTGVVSLINSLSADVLDEPVHTLDATKREILNQKRLLRLSNAFATRVSGYRDTSNYIPPYFIGTDPNARLDYVYEVLRDVVYLSQRIGQGDIGGVIDTPLELRAFTNAFRLDRVIDMHDAQKIEGVSGEEKELWEDIKIRTPFRRMELPTLDGLLSREWRNLPIFREVSNVFIGAGLDGGRNGKLDVGNEIEVARKILIFWRSIGDCYDEIEDRNLTSFERMRNALRRLSNRNSWGLEEGKVVRGIVEGVVENLGLNHVSENA